jgi:hypothetical protein
VKAEPSFSLKMAKVMSVTKDLCVIHWQLDEFRKVPTNVERQETVEGHANVTCAKSQLTLDASFTYFPLSSKIKLNISFQGAEESKNNTPHRVIISLAGQTFVLNPKEEGLWKSMEFDYSFQRRPTEEKHWLANLLPWKKYLPSIPAFNFTIEFDHATHE